MSASAAPILELDRVNTFRGVAHVLRGVSLRVGPAECVCLVGRNGAGKTTTLETAIGLLGVRGGRIAVRGRDVTRLAAHQRARLGIGYAPEDAGIFPDLTVEENLQIGRWLAPAGPDARTVDARILALFPEIEALTSRRGLNLSGGQKKMVAIARAMALSPSVLLLDEPFEGLAPVVVTRFIDAARRIKDMGISLLIAESHVTNAARVADRLYAIDRGEIIFEGAPQRALDDADVMKTLRG
ncbi:MAG TPA: ABC transporter ATP-binding protein [Methylomirabilota bacterium]|nr:ABC transporter ATP-binding protein [Methylomirabilota bacterium]